MTELRALQAPDQSDVSEVVDVVRTREGLDHGRNAVRLTGQEPFATEVRSLGTVGGWSSTHDAVVLPQKPRALSTLLPESAGRQGSNTASWLVRDRQGRTPSGLGICCESDNGWRL